MKRVLLLYLLLLCCNPALVPAHELHLKNGHIISTDNVWREGDTVHYEQYGGTVSIPYNLVKGVVYKRHQEKKGAATEQRSKAEQRSEEQIPPEKDLAAKLNKALSPKNPVEEASLCTLSVKTAAGFGSGFFISEDGYIITNKHVVRGSEKQFRQIEAKIAQSRQNLQQYKRSLDTAAKRQKSYRDDLEEKDALLEKLKKTGRIDRADFKAKQQELREAEQRLREEEKR
ncbi:MAG: hypothetical protein D3914_14885, partial [Candidatus Electrothrix sp. LOE2]|nr:hypothetical protein [Candidatus Electrothrix sp. LOE2]